MNKIPEIILATILIAIAFGLTVAGNSAAIVFLLFGVVFWIDVIVDLSSKDED